MTEWTLGDILDVVADVVPDRTMTVCGDRRSTFAQVRDRTRRLGNFLADNGFGRRHDAAPQHDRHGAAPHHDRDGAAPHHDRDGAAPPKNWECPQDRIALVMRNDLYPDVMIGCLKARVVPVNVNRHYTAGEIRNLLEYVGPRGVVYHRSLGDSLREAVESVRPDLLIAVDDGSTDELLPGSITLDEALALGDPDRVIPTSPDDLVMMCTGGTTGRPKGVLWRQSDMYVAAMSGDDHSAQTLRDIASSGGQVWFAVSPLLHAAGVWTALAGVLGGQTVVLYDDRKPFDARTVLETIERERVFLMTMVGDAYAGPLVEQMRSGRYDLTSLFAIGTGGAATNPVHKQAIIDHLPQVTVIDGYGSSETGGLGFGNTGQASKSETFLPRPGGAVVSQDRSRFLSPGEDEIGWAARTGRIPLGYYGDREATERTFPVIDGRRVAVPGDRATLDVDGTIRLIGRDSLVVNTGGEKVFVEEVEEVLRTHPEVADALVVGRPSERWGQEVVALVQRAPGGAVDDTDLRALCRARLAGYKVPKAVFFVAAVGRLGNGKPDYRWARDTVAAHTNESISLTTDIA